MIERQRKGEFPLKDLLEGVSVVDRKGRSSDKFRDVCRDSRKVEEGDIYFAIKGVHTDGHDFIAAAIERGARAVVVDRPLDEVALQGGVHYVQVSDAALAYGIACSNYFSRPSHHLRLVGVTGTNGKTSIVRLLHQLCERMNYPAGVISTIGCKIRDAEVASESGLTTPDAYEVNRLLHMMVEAGCHYAFMEVSSHAVVQKRIAGLEFAGGIFSNLTRDHLDYHGTTMAYRDAKKAFFDGLPTGSFMLFNANDRNGDFMCQNTPARIRSFSRYGIADYPVYLVSETTEGMELRFGGQEVWVRLHGEFNVDNIAAVFGCAMELGFPRSIVVRSISGLEPIEGRFEMVYGPDKRIGVVDFAHTPSAIHELLRSVRALAGEARIITVVGAGGDRDHGKRPDMGRLAARNSDWLIITSDNPRSEDPNEILNQIYEGVDAEHRGSTLLEVDRAKAIRSACMISRPGDIIVVAGKGHEKYQILHDRVIDFDDRKVLEASFAELGPTA